ncbi:MAG: hypothetical protein WD118_05265, partial [Phycisphaeraceae bacterium]
MKRQTHHRLRGMLAWCTAGALAVLAVPATAQQQADTSGRALDANPGAGSGGVNQQGEQLDFRVRNDVVTG